MSEAKTSGIENESLERLFGEGNEIIIKRKSEKIDDKEGEQKDKIENYVEENEERLRRVSKRGRKHSKAMAKALLKMGGKEL